MAPIGGNQNQAVTSVGFTPIAVLFYWTAQSTTGFATDAAIGYGFATATADRAVAFASQNNLYPNNPSRSQWTTRCVVVMNSIGVVDGEASLNSMDADGFTVRWQPAGSTAWIIHYMALGGPDLTNAAIGTYRPTPGAISFEAVTGVGFQPDFLMFLSIDSNTVGSTVTPHGKVSLGFDGGPGTRGGITAVSRTGGANIITSGAQRTDYSIVEKDTAVGTMTFLGYVSNFGADGFTVYKAVNAPGTETDVHYLALKGGQYGVGAITRPTTNAPPTLRVPYTGVGFTPRGLVFASWNLVAQTAGDQEARISFSAADSTPSGFNQRATFFHDKIDDPADSDWSWVRQGTLGTAGANGKVAYLAQAGDCRPNPLFSDPPGSAQCSGGPRLISNADVLSYDADGFTLGWTTNDRTNANQIPGDEENAQVLYVAFGRPPTQALYRSVGTDAGDLNPAPARTVTISGSTATFSGPMPDKVGVGDVLQYQVSSTWYLAFIHGRTSDQIYTVRNAGGGVPQAAIAGTAVNVYRAYTSLFNWEAQTENASINAAVQNFDTSTNLVTANTVMNVACYGDGEDTTQVTINGWTTDPLNSIKIYTPYLPSEVGVSQRHRGVWDVSKYVIRSTYAPIDIGNAGAGTNSVWIDGLQVYLDSVTGNGNSGIITYQTGAANHRISNNIVRGVLSNSFDNYGILFYEAAAGSVVRIWNNIVYDFSGSNRGYGIGIASGSNPQLTAYVYNNTVYSCFFGIRNQGASSTVVAKNNVYRSAGLAGSPDGYGGTFAAASDYNSSDKSADAPVLAPRVNNASPWYSGATADASIFVAPAGSPRDLHLLTSTILTSVGADLTSDASLPFRGDIDAQTRPSGPATWDLGADEYGPPTAVELLSFEASPADFAVALLWRTGSELDNLGFHLYRSVSDSGPWTRITASLIPGLGSSPEGASYSFRDTGLTNGVRYFYRLEDIDARSGSTFHGPVSAVPGAAPPSEEGDSGDSDPDESDDASGSEGGDPVSENSPDASRTYGRPEAASFRVVSRTKHAVVVELRTPGFLATPTPSGVRVSVPGFDQRTDPRAPDLPVKRVVLDAVVGRHARIAWVQERQIRSFPGLTPAAVGAAEIVTAPDGTVRPGRRAASLRVSSEVLLPPVAARIAGDAFIGETKKLALEMSPLRYDAVSDELRLAQTLRVKIAFDRKAAREETGRGSRGRHRPRSIEDAASQVLAHLHTQTRGLHAVSFETLSPQGHEAVPLDSLRLSRQGLSVPFHVEPNKKTFGPGSVLYFYASTEAASTDYSPEVAYALEQAPGGVPMPSVSTSPRGSKDRVSASLAEASFETNRYYQAGLLDAPDIWLWDFMVGGMSKSFPLSVEGLDPTSALPAHLQVVLQGASEAETEGEHHLSVSLNGTPLGETSFDGKLPHVFSTSVPASLLQEGENALTVTNLGDTGVYSFVFLDRVDLVYPQTPALRSGLFSGVFSEAGEAVVSGEASVGLDVTDPEAPVWMSALRPRSGMVSFGAEAAHRYVLASAEGLLSPRVSAPLRSTLRSPTNQAEYVLIAPEAFLEAARPLLERRQDQGLTAKAVSFEEIASEFGHGRGSAQAIRDFLAYAYHSWTEPSLRYVLLLGDSSYDPRNFSGFDQGAPLPAMWAKTSYLWTASDPILGAVNGEDLLPDVAIGRLPAKTLEQAQALVQKVLAFEDSAQDLSGTAVFVADNPDLGGDFEANVMDIQASFLGARPTKTLFLRQLGGNTRGEILASFDAGASLMSYVGHGGAAVWASENVLNSWDTEKLLAQSRQPLLLTFNCLNGYFVAPNYEALSEAFLKVEGRGTIGAFSPSGLSLDGPAHLFHRALMAEIAGGTHARLGDAVVAAQADYTEEGVMPELLAIYHLLADPAMKIQ